MSISISEIAQRIHDCQACPLAENRTGVVPGVGPEDADLMLIGEAPGAKEDQSGIPFSGPAGHYLDQLLHDNGLDRDRIFITNIVKCRPLQNRTPKPAEIQACRHHLQNQINVVQPRLIATIGLPATRWFQPDAKSMTEVAGMVRKHGSSLVMPVMHPAAGLHKGSNRPFIADNFARLAEFHAVALLRPRATPEPVVETEPAPRSQQTLF